MKQNKEQKWYPTEYNSTWCIEDIESRDVLDIEQVGKEQAEYNAKLCASAPQMKVLLKDVFNYIYGYYGSDIEDNEILKKLAEKHEQLCKEQQ